MTDLVAIEDIGQFICSQFRVGADVWTCPADSHLPCCDRLKLKVPLSLGDGVWLFSSEDAYFVPPCVLQTMASWRQKKLDGWSSLVWFYFLFNQANLLLSWSGGSIL